ncbi:hypothetical protein AIOL_001815 [Candidatus Rhodobacter oscarellae]|uniref:Uncharacterized protein n=1 Tax=Candidatus Rhodobacter oscarellae TaxID=1675527 RepID=A0A0J9GTM7_9RHOB|nr:hypothetical protein [Candidatus Rhodobacter lobularis]KMW56858.1 hypothetical protein AIOL_001815 [Candidatus Rhodobacter lobularis]
MLGKACAIGALIWAGLGGAGWGCAYLEELEPKLLSDLQQREGSQTATFPKLRNGARAEIELSFRDEAGAPRVYDRDGEAVAIFPRSYYLPALAWVDAFAVCAMERSNCAQLGAFAQAYKTTELGDHIPFAYKLIQEAPGACDLRGTPQYEVTFVAAYEMIGMALQSHELGHLVLGHLDRMETVGKPEEAHADAIAHYLVAQADTSGGTNAVWAAMALMPLINSAFASDLHPDVACRAYFMSNGNVNFRDETQDCTAYEADIAEGQRLRKGLIGPETELIVR